MKRKQDELDDLYIELQKTLNIQELNIVSRIVELELLLEQESNK
jgi:hypothetical protein